MTRESALKVLGFKPTETPSDKEIRKAWKSLAKKYHPDVNTTDEAEDKFKLVATAYQTLSNSKNIDSILKEEFPFDFQASEQNARELLKKKKPRPDLLKVKPSDLYLGEVMIPLECFLTGDSAKVVVTVEEPCKSCYENSNIWIPCKLCDQYGKTVETNTYSGVMFGHTLKKCKQCQGRGWFRKMKCGECNGSMKITIEKEIEFTVPDSYYKGHKTITLSKMGNKGRHCEDGDIKLTISPQLTKLNKLTTDEKNLLTSLLNKGGKGD